jgi:Uncharacterized protein conserved in bacteria (DUF2272)
LRRAVLLSLGFAVTLIASAESLQAADYGRLPAQTLEVTPPSDRVRGGIGKMAMRELACRARPVAEARRRIVDVAAQEWGFFGFPIVDYTTLDDERSDPSPFFEFGRDGQIALVRPGWRGRFPALPQEEAVRLAPSVAGYWAVTPQGAQMIGRQNEAWDGPWGIDGRWADPWSAAFISWVMCEAGLGDTAQFQRAIAHWSYIDQAIRARDGDAPRASYVAYDIGEDRILPGDLICSSRRPTYRSIDQRRRQMGNGARTHCDIVVKVDEPGKRVFAIGGNVRRAVALKMFPATVVRGNLRPGNVSNIDDERPLFAHLKLRAGAIQANALDTTPTLRALDCDLVFAERHPAYGLLPVGASRDAC